MPFVPRLARTRALRLPAALSSAFWMWRIKSSREIASSATLMVTAGAPLMATPKLAGELEAFLSVVRNGGRPVVDAEDGLWAVAIATSLLTAAAEGRAVDLSTLSSRFAPV